MYQNTYEEAYQGFLDRGLVLDTPKELFHFRKKSDCHCQKHPQNKMKYAWQYVRLGRFSCKECRKEKGRQDLTIEEKKENIKSWGLEYVDGDLSKVMNSIRVRCKNQHIFPRNYDNLSRGNIECPFCMGITPVGYWCKETCQLWLDENMNGYTILEIKREDGELRVFVKCPIPSHEPYWTSWGHIQHEKTGCKQCYYEREGKVDWTLDNAKIFLKENGYTMLDENEYINSHEPVYCEDELGFIYQIRIHFILRGRTGFALLRNNKYAIHNIRLFCKLFRPDYEFISNTYTGSHNLHSWKYLGEGLPDGANRDFEMTVDNFMTANCKHPMLSKSSLELKCEFILNKYGLEYETQKTFEGCVGKNKLRYDFYLEISGRKICIETDGLQHEMPIEKFGGIDAFIKRRKYDEIKNKYCLDNDIELIRIPQKQIKYMENILVKELRLKEESVA